MEVKFTNLTVSEARYVEQLLISTYTLENLLNARREISIQKLDSFKNSTDNVLKLFANLAEDEVLTGPLQQAVDSGLIQIFPLK